MEVLVTVAPICRYHRVAAIIPQLPSLPYHNHLLSLYLRRPEIDTIFSSSVRYAFMIDTAQPRSETSRTTGPLPLVIGVTGHRNLREEDLPELRQIVRRVLIELRERAPHTPLEVLSPLAEGADRLVAEVAFELGERVVVPLPMPIEMYEKDFESEESCAEFKRLLARADEVVELPLSEDTILESVAEYGPDRDRRYGVMGAWIVRNSHLLLALWDGVISHLPHGTADIVKFNLEGIPEEFSRAASLIEPPEGDPVYHIVTPRRDAKVPEDAMSMKLLFPPRFSQDNEGEARLNAVINATERFNRDVLTQPDDFEVNCRQSIEWVAGDDVKEIERLGHAPTLRLFALADSLANRFAGHTKVSLKWIFILVALSAVFFDIYTHVYLLMWPLLGTYLLGLVVVYFLVVRSSKGEFHSRYLDYRALAEGLRVRLFWDVAGVEDEIADNYLHKQRSELDWIRYALRVWKPRSAEGTGFLTGTEYEPAHSPHLSDEERIEIVRRRWIEDQRSYFARSAAREEHAAHRAVKYGNIFIIIGILLALFQVVAQAVGNPDFTKEPSHWLLVAVALSPIFAGLSVGYAEKRAHHDHARQYERMATHFSNAAARLTEFLDAGDIERSRRLMEEIGKETLAENGDWVLIHRDRPIEAPKG